jgi:hypothetical protein
VNAPVNVKDLRDGDLIDLRHLPFFAELPADVRETATDSYCRVEARPRRRNGVLHLHTELGAWPVEADLTVPLVGKD